MVMVEMGKEGEVLFENIRESNLAAVQAVALVSRVDAGAAATGDWLPSARARARMSMRMLMF